METGLSLGRGEGVVYPRVAHVDSEGLGVAAVDSLSFSFFIPAGRLLAFSPALELSVVPLSL